MANTGYHTLQELAKLPSAELRARSLFVSCRFYSCALSQLAAAKDAWRLGDERTAGLHVDQAEKAWLRANEAEEARAKRCQALLRERGEVCEVGVHRGAGVVISMRETHRADGSRRSLATSASEVR